MLKRLREKLKKRWKDFIGRKGRVPTTYKQNSITKVDTEVTFLSTSV